VNHSKGHIALEQMGSADPPLAVHCLYGGRHRQHRRRGTGESIPPAWASWRCSRSPYSRSPVCTCSCGATGEAPTERAADRKTMARRRGLGGGHRRAPGALVLPLAPPAGHAGERLTARLGLLKYSLLPLLEILRCCLSSKGCPIKLLA